MSVTSSTIDAAAVDRELYLISYAIFSTLFVIASLYYCMDILGRYEEGRINARLCCGNLNLIIPLKTFFHIHLSFMLLVFGHPYLFLANVPMMIWHWKYLPLGYNQYKIGEPGRLDAYKWIIASHLYFFWTCFAIYTYYLTFVAFDKIALLQKSNLETGVVYLEGEELLLGL